MNRDMAVEHESVDAPGAAGAIFRAGCGRAISACSFAVLPNPS
jgi:hypothetical protein